MRLPRQTLEERFWSRVAAPNERGCRLWIGATRGGYGRLSRGLDLACEIHNGPPPPDRPHALHACNVELCCEGSHLRWGTDAENRADSASRGRAQVPKPASGVRKLTRADWPLILQRHLGGENKTALARAFGVTRPRIGQVLRQAVVDG